MSQFKHPESSPLFESGPNTISICRLKKLVVEQFPESGSRRSLFRKLVATFKKFRALGLSCEVWLDGSFLTRKLDPKDVDFTCVFEGEAIDSLPLQLQPRFENLCLELKADELLDFSRVAKYPIGNPNYEFSVDNMAFWEKQWSTARSGEHKGFAVLHI